MARDLRLVRFQYFYQKADADLIISNEIDEAQTGRISKGLEEQSHVVVLVTHRYDRGVSDSLRSATRWDPAIESTIPTS